MREQSQTLRYIQRGWPGVLYRPMWWGGGYLAAPLRHPLFIIKAQRLQKSSVGEKRPPVPASQEARSGSGEVSQLAQMWLQSAFGNICSSLAVWSLHKKSAFTVIFVLALRLAAQPRRKEVMYWRLQGYQTSRKPFAHSAKSPVKEGGKWMTSVCGTKAATVY